MTDKSARDIAHRFVKCDGGGATMVGGAAAYVGTVQLGHRGACESLTAAIEAYAEAAAARAQEEAAQTVLGMGPGKPTGGGDFDGWTLDEIAERIRAQETESRDNT